MLRLPVVADTNADTNANKLSDPDTDRLPDADAHRRLSDPDTDRLPDPDAHRRFADPDAGQFSNPIANADTGLLADTRSLPKPVLPCRARSRSRAGTESR